MADFELPGPILFGPDEITFREEMFPSHDGVRLRTLFVFPNTPGPVPVIVQRSCYPGQEEGIRKAAMAYAERGFGYVLQMCRGTGGSEGVWEPNVNDRADGLHLMNYLNAQPYVRVMGYHGASYLSFTGWIMADAMPEKVKALYLTVYGTDRHTSAYKDGLFRQDILTAWAMDNAGHPVTADYLESAAFRPQIEVDTALWGGELSWYRDWISHTSRTDPYWSQGLWKQLREIPEKVKIPVFLVEGWYDHHLGSALNGYCALNEETKGHSVLKIGPWNHGFQPAISGHPAQQNGFSTGEADMFRWFYDILVKGEIPEKKIDWYVIGEDKWLSLPEYPVQAEKTAAFYLGEGGTLNGPAEATTALSTAEGTRSYIYDPANPVPSHGAESLFKSWSEIGSLLQPAMNSRPDIVSFISEPLPQDLTILGRPAAELYVSSSAEDSCFTFKLMEVFENGEAYNIRNGITTLAYRNGAPDRLTYTPGTVEKIRIEAWDVAWQLKKGSRLRIDISSSNFPEYAVHPNKAGVWSRIRETETARQTICYGGDCPSRIILPLA